MDTYTSVHNHTYYSLLDGLNKPQALAQKAKDMGMRAIGITDHGTLAGIPEFYQACRTVGIKPILGVEAYCVPDRHVHEKYASPSGRLLTTGYHLVLLAKNLKGYMNLIALINAANQEGFYYKPKIDFDILSKHREGLICTSACLSSELAQNALVGHAKSIAAKYKELFGDDYYFELMDNDMVQSLQRDMNKWLVPLAKSMGIKAIPTCDAHYLNENMTNVHDMAICMQMKKPYSGTGKSGYDGIYHLKSQEDLMRVFPDPQLTANTIEIAEKIEEFEIFDQTMKLPYMPAADSYLARVTKRKLELLNIDDPAHRERLDKELAVIKKKDFATYFLTTREIINEIKSLDCPLHIRGSAGGSLVCYAMGITNIDPLKNGLLFERFLNESRSDHPDIDIDVPQKRRQEVMGKIVEKFGAGKVAHVATSLTLQPKVLIRDLCRTLGESNPIADHLSYLVPFEADTYEKLAADEKLMEAIDNLEESDLFKSVLEHMIGLPRHAGTHASGIVIADRPIVENIPIYIDKEGKMVTQYNKDYIGNFGFLKFDILGLTTLDVVYGAAKDVNFDLSAISMDDAATFKLIGEGRVVGVFQLDGSKKYMELCKTMKPKNMKEINDIVALFRPGVMDSDQLKVYLRNRKNPKDTVYLLPELEPVLKESHGVCIFQEEMMKFAVVYAGYTPIEAENLRKTISKKSSEMMEQQKSMFMEKSAALGRENVDQAWQIVEAGARYNWNKAHAVAYGLITYYCAYLSVHYPLYFFKNLIDFAIHEDDKFTYLSEAMLRDIKILPPDVNRSTERTSIDDDGIRLGLLSMKGIGEKYTQKIIANRPYDNIAKVQKVLGMMVSTIMKAANALESVPNQSTFNPVLKANEMQILGISLRGMREEYQDIIKEVKAVPWQKVALTGTSMIVAQVMNVKTHIDSRGGTMAFLTIMDVHGPKIDITMFADTYLKDKPKKNEVYAMAVAPTTRGYQVVGIRHVQEYRQ